jgi:glucarate dehydratase
MTEEIRQLQPDPEIRSEWHGDEMRAMRISKVTITPVAFADPPLLNSVGVHEPFALRAVIEVATDAGLAGLGETYADEKHLDALRAAGAAVVGADVYHTEEIYRRVQAVAMPATTIASGLIGDSAAADRVFSPFEVACLDIQGQAAGRPVADLLGGAVRDEVPFSAYLFFKWAAHPGADPDDWGAALDPDGIVAQARRMVDGYGFTALKLKGGVFPPEQEAEAIRALRRAFPGHPLRLDPNAAWTVDTAVTVARDLDGVLEYLEDPTPGGGAIRVPGAPGLGVELDRDALTRLHEQYLRCGIRNRDDTGYMQRVNPGYRRQQPRW